MKTTSQKLLSAVSALCLAALTSSADSFSENFDGATLSTNLFVRFSTNSFPPPLTGTNTFSFALSGGRGLLAKQTGGGNGYVAVYSHCALVGDFSVTVQSGYTGLGSSGALGLGVVPVFASSGADIYFLAPNLLDANIHIPPEFSTRAVSSPATSASFRIIRTGNTLTLRYDTGSGLQTLHSATRPTFSSAMVIVFFLMNQAGDTTSHSGWLDNLSVTADQIIYPPWPGANTAIYPAVEICWPTHLDRYYQVQWCSALDTNTWFDFGSPIIGNGTTNSLFDSTRTQDKRFYRVLESP